MKLNIYQVDAFENKPLEGNPAAIIPLEEWLSDELMQAIAAENNLSETAYFVEEGNGYKIRWFTPVQEVDLCGHATLASSYVIFDILGYENKEILAAFTQLTPYWSKKMNNKKLFSKQASKRGGEVKSIDLGERVLISGKAAKYMVGTIEI